MTKHLFFKIWIVLFILSFNFAATAQSDGGDLFEATDTVCSGNNRGVLRLQYDIGDAMYWEYSPGGLSPWTTINNTNDSLEYNNLTQTTHFRAIVKDGSYPADTSSVAIVHVSPLSSGGILPAGETVCEESNSGTIELTGYTGKIDHWEYSNDTGTVWNKIHNTSSELTFNNLSITNHYRAIVKSGVCQADTSTSTIIIVSPATNTGTLSGSDTVCHSQNQGDLIVSGHTGDIVRWESSQTGNSPWTTINHLNDTLAYSGLIETNFYRTVVKSGICNEIASNSVELQVSPPSKGGIVSGSDDVCAKLNQGTLVLSDNTGEIIKWQSSADFGTNWTDIANINHTLNYSGLTRTTTYRAVIKSGACDAVFSEVATITIHPLPEMDFSTDTVCRTQPSVFNNTSTLSSGNILYYSWDFGNGNGNNSVNPVYTYPNDGEYHVTLTATTDKGCINDTSMMVRVNPTPVVAFSFNNQCDRVPVQFSNLSFSTIDGETSNYWDFDDLSEPSTENDPTHLFPQNDNYQVKLIVTEAATGCKDSLTKTVEIFPRTVPDFTVSDVCQGNESIFENKTTLNGSTANFTWTFGDHNSSQENNPDHYYNKSGLYRVYLTATTDHNCVDTISKNVRVYDQPEAEFSFDNICFTDSAEFINKTSITEGMSYLWSFGDGTTSINQNTKIYYNAPGTYSVSLSATSANNCSDEKTQNITVFELPKVNFSAENVCLGNPVEFNNLSSAQAVELNYVWDFGNNENSNDHIPVYTYAEAGSYDVKLIASTGSMCSDSAFKQVTIFPSPQPDFTVENVCDGSPSNFYNRSTIPTGNIASYSWDFGDETNSIQENPVHQYLNPGTYNASLSVISDNGCTESITRSVTTDYLPLADFSINNVCDQNPVKPANFSRIKEGNLKYSWDFDAHFSSTLPEPAYVFDTPGTYQITLRISSDHNCVDSLIRFVQVYNLPDVKAGEDISISKGESTRLSASGGNSYSWYPSDGISNAYVSNPTANPSETTRYVLRAEDIYTCSNYDTLTITVVDDYKIKPNNIITPDENGVNDVWVIENIESYENGMVYIFDRWGNEVYSKKSYDNTWAGKNKNGDILPDGTYYYIVKFDESNLTYKGAITLLRNK